MITDGLARDVARVVTLASDVVADHVKSCQASLLMAEKAVRAAATNRYGLANAWMHFADPTIVDLGHAIRDLGQHND